MDRETMYQGLFQLLSPLGPVTSGGNGTFVTQTRRLKHVDDVQPEEMPYIAQNQIDEDPFKDTMDGAGRLSVKLLWYIYIALDPNDTAASTPALNPIVQAVINLLPGPSFGVTINNVQFNVSRGKIQYFEGLLNTKAVAKIEVNVIAPFA